MELIYFTGKHKQHDNDAPESEILCGYGGYGVLRVIAVYHSREIGRSEENNIWSRPSVIEVGKPGPDDTRTYWETKQNDDGSYYIIIGRGFDGVITRAATD